VNRFFVLFRDSLDNAFAAFVVQAAKEKYLVEIEAMPVGSGRRLSEEEHDETTKGKDSFYHLWTYPDSMDIGLSSIFKG
jgi:hypothetical protein